MGRCFCCCCCYCAQVWSFVCIVAPLVFPNSGIRESLECASCNRRLHTRHRHWVRAGINKCARTLNPTRSSEATELLGKGPALWCKDKDDAFPSIGYATQTPQNIFWGALRVSPGLFLLQHWKLYTNFKRANDIKSLANLEENWEQFRIHTTDWVTASNVDKSSDDAWENKIQDIKHMNMMCMYHHHLPRFRVVSHYYTWCIFWLRPSIQGHYQV
jgi:hypothetical protein